VNQNYFSEVKAALIVSPVVEYFDHTHFLKDREGYLQIQAFLTNDDVMEIFLYITLDEKPHINKEKPYINKYRVNWQSREGILKRRWDNISHYPDIETFPQHVHIGEEVYPHQFFDVFEIIEVVEKEISIE
jgi:hypothetical protein